MYEENGRFKGEALITYYKIESVDLALKLLDESDFRPGHNQIIKVTKATFEEKPNQEKPKQKKYSKKMKLYDQSKELTWDEDDTRHVVIKNMFTQDEAWNDPNFFEELEEDLRIECEKFGVVEKVKIFQRNPEGVAIVKFEDHLDAEDCIKSMNGRWFSKRQLEAYYYDNWTNFEVKETEEQAAERHKKFEDWIEQKSEETEE